MSVFEVDPDIRKARTLAADFYTDQAYFELSKEKIFELSWQPHLPSGAAESGRVLCTGHSCRSQLKRFAALHARHPAEVLAAGLA